MKNYLQNSNTLEDKKIDWNAVQSAMKKKLGQDIFDSWLKKMELIQEFNNYVMISVSTRFIRDWITSRYLDQILQIIKEFKKSNLSQTDKDALEIMGLNYSSSWEEVQKKFKKLVKKYHPDKNHGNKILEDKLKKITLAYTQLKNKLRKK